jgi:hypothetical protein
MAKATPKTPKQLALNMAWVLEAFDVTEDRNDIRREALFTNHFIKYLGEDAKFDLQTLGASGMAGERLDQFQELVNRAIFLSKDDIRLEKASAVVKEMRLKQRQLGEVLHKETDDILSPEACTLVANMIIEGVPIVHEIPGATNFLNNQRMLDQLDTALASMGKAGAAAHKKVTAFREENPPPRNMFRETATFETGSTKERLEAFKASVRDGGRVSTVALLHVPPKELSAMYDALPTTSKDPQMKASYQEARSVLQRQLAAWHIVDLIGTGSPAETKFNTIKNLAKETDGILFPMAVSKAILEGLSPQQRLELYYAFPKQQDMGRTLANSLCSIFQTTPLTYHDLRTADLTVKQLTALAEDMPKEAKETRTLIKLAITQKEEVAKVKPSDKAVTAIADELRYTGTLEGNGRALLSKLSAPQLLALDKEARKVDGVRPKLGQYLAAEMDILIRNVTDPIPQATKDKFAALAKCDATPGEVKHISSASVLALYEVAPKGAQAHADMAKMAQTKMNAILQEHGRDGSVRLPKESRQQVAGFLNLGTRLRVDSLNGMSEAQLEQLHKDLPTGKAGDRARGYIQEFQQEVADQGQEIIHVKLGKPVGVLSPNSFEIIRDLAEKGHAISQKDAISINLNTQQLLTLYTTIPAAPKGNQSRKNIANVVASELTLSELYKANYTPAQLASLAKDIPSDDDKAQEMVAMASIQLAELSKRQPSDMAVQAIYYEAKDTGGLLEPGKMLIARLSPVQLKALGNAAKDDKTASTVITAALTEQMHTLLTATPSKATAEKIAALDKIGIKHPMGTHEEALSTPKTFTDIHAAYRKEFAGLVPEIPAAAAASSTAKPASRAPSDASDVTPAGASSSASSSQSLGELRKLSASPSPSSQNEVKHAGGAPWVNPVSIMMHMVGAWMGWGTKPDAPSTPTTSTPSKGTRKE